ncbi:TPA: hypothetical protein LSG62_004981 [Serratia liquefaciens]|uniref:hypothetical protein n=1 Tax=Serratia entomophila TaxID=42906 RepID=UPI001F4BF3E8|nr:hypothetical protein [Serratia entomophila]ULG10678.1 hypothetical protein 176p2_00015 [Serratia entomophila]ULG10731.1 hypothetical protein 176p2_00068 [Serratia entomophila]HBL6732162.1 hypothetical protein [Serratia liquefaciens]
MSTKPKVQLPTRKVTVETTQETTTEQVTAFIREGDKRPESRKKVKPTLFTLTEEEKDFVEITAKRTGATKTNVIRAALKTLAKLDDNDLLMLLGEISLRSPGRWN